MRSTLNRSPDRPLRRSATTPTKSEWITKLQPSLSPSTSSPLKLLRVCIKTRRTNRSELETRVSWLDMPVMKLPTSCPFLTIYHHPWSEDLSSAGNRRFCLGSDLMERCKLPLNMRRKAISLSLKESILFWFQLNTILTSPTRNSGKMSSMKSSRRPFLKNCSSILDTLSIQVKNSWLEVPTVTQDLLAAKLSEIPTEVGEDTEEVLSRAKIPQKSTDQLPTLPDGSLKT